ncbi:hypothetical protein SNEBB_009951 [Seison nebaliae]|nr:hypothetical protein SNEBB_009951 [Seison nebaliae]
MLLAIYPLNLSGGYFPDKAWAQKLITSLQKRSTVKNHYHLLFWPYRFDVKLREELFYLTQHILIESLNTIHQFTCHCDMRSYIFNENLMLVEHLTISNLQDLFDNSEKILALHPEILTIESFLTSYSEKMEIVNDVIFHRADAIYDDSDFIYGPKPTEFYGRTLIEGFFDHLHLGHKLILNFAGLTCDICDQSQLVINIYPSTSFEDIPFRPIAQSYTERKDNVLTFIKFLYPSLNIRILESDNSAEGSVQRMSRTDSNVSSINQEDQLEMPVQCIVTAHHHLERANNLNEKRKLKNWKLVDFQIFPQYSYGTKEIVNFSLKIPSSSYYRCNLLGKVLGKNEITNNFSNLHVIGVSSVIDSSISKLIKYLKKINNKRQIIDFFLISQFEKVMFEPDSVLYNELKERFGEQHIKNRIDIKQLAGFANSTIENSTILDDAISRSYVNIVSKKLEDYNEKIKNGKKLERSIVILEMKLTQKAYFDKIVDEIWIMIDNQKNVRQNLLDSNTLTEEEMELYLQKNYSIYESYRDIWQYFVDKYGDIVISGEYGDKYMEHQAALILTNLLVRLKKVEQLT